MSLVKVSELTGEALDWAVATVEKMPLRRDPMGVGDKAGTYWVWPEGWPPPKPGYMRVGRAYSPSTDWSQGGPIIEREIHDLGMDLWSRCYPVPDGMCAATYGRGAPDCYVYGPTPLIAAMRCYVASRLGDEVEIPEELT